MKPVIVGATFVRVVTNNSRSTSIDEVTVTKVGRKWASITKEWNGRPYDAGRFNKETGLLDGGGYSSPGRVYDDREAYDRQVRVEALWREFNRAVRDQYGVPNGVGEIEILKAADALGIRLKGE